MMSSTFERSIRGDESSTCNNGISDCPVESGVVRSDWGTIAGGSLIAGIAAGLQPQNVLISDESLIVDNRYAATLTGDLSEVVLLQGPSGNELDVGGSGDWNNTEIPRNSKLK